MKDCDGVVGLLGSASRSLVIEVGHGLLVFVIVG